MRTFIRYLIVPLLAGMAALAQAEDYDMSADSDEARVLFADMQKASTSKNYELLFTRVSAGQIEPVSFSHGLTEAGSISHWLFLNGEPSGYFTKGGLIVYFAYGTEPFAVKNALLPSVFVRLMQVPAEKILKSYTPVLLGEKRIAGRLAREIRLTAMDNYRYSYILHVDSKTGILLGAEVVHHNPGMGNDSLMESFNAVNLAVSDTPNAKVLNVENASESFPNPADNAEPLEKFSWSLKELPPGFEPVFSQRYALGDGLDTVEHIVYSDGIADFSIYRIPLIGNMDFPVVRQGRTNLYRHQAPPYEIVAVGDLPLEAEKRIAESYRGG
ncbi:MucB/RseB C-terminal domain-containing protein [Succinimonas sp.]|uniref:MucB/RseB C-terminal domain-containing protein n=2 Tax=Succinimonas sp. TaxID=1936151 RepID=UPI0038671FB3